MRVLIENYRGWEIYFDTAKEDFYTVSNEYDRQESKRSYASTKKFIDEYIKENNEFKPIKVQKMPSVYGNGETITLIGIRKDGAFMYENKDGKKSQLGNYNENDYFLVDSRNEEVFKKIDELSIKWEKIREEIVQLQKSVIKVTVRELRKRMTGKE